MYQPTPTLLHDVVKTEIADRQVRAERDRLARRAGTEHRPRLYILPPRPAPGRLIRFPDRTGPAPEAA